MARLGNVLEALSPDDLVDASDGDVYARVAVLNGTAGDHAWTADGAVVWTSMHRGRPSFVGVGPAAAVGAVVGAVAEQVPAAERASLPRGWTDALPSTLSASELSHWDWMWTDTAPPPTRGADQVRWLGPADDDAVRALLREVSPGASTWPGDDRSRRWAGVVDQTGRLVACLADTSRGPSVGNLSSVAVAHDARRNGYGRAVVSWAARQYFAEGAQLVTLGMYSDNDAARAMYQRLGFRCEHAFTGAALARATARASCPAC